MKLSLKFIDIKTKMPKPDTNVILLYRKGQNKLGTGSTGDFIVEGYFDKKRSIWYDYTNRKLWTMREGNKSLNKVLMWAEIPDDFLYDG
jgi:hypothetical protein